MAEKDIIENTKAQDQKDTDSSITSLANDNLNKKRRQLILSLIKQ